MNTMGQGIIEYTIVIGAVIAVIVIAASGIIQPAVDGALNEAGAVVETSANNLLAD